MAGHSQSSLRGQRIPRIGSGLTRAGLTKALIVEEAARLADEIGWDRLSLALVADRLGVRSPSLYNYIAGMDELKRELTLFVLDGIADSMGRAMIGKFRDQAARALAVGLREFIASHPGLYRATIPAADPKDKEYAAAQARVESVCLEGIRGYGLDRETGLLGLRAIRSVVHGFAMIEVAGGWSAFPTAERTFQWAVDCCIEALRHAAARATRGRRPRAAERGNKNRR